jgi:hypothetical protein
MKFLGKLILWLLITLLLMIIAAYFLLQTQWGARQASAWLSDGTGWTVSFNKLAHNFSSPMHLQLQNVTLGRDGKPATLVAKRWISVLAAASLATRCMLTKSSSATAR